MKIHRAWIRATAAAAIAAVGTQVAVGQYAPYGVAPQSPNQYPTQYSNVAPYGVPQAQQEPVYPTTAQAPVQQQMQQQAAYPATSMARPAYPQPRPPQQQPYGVGGPKYPQTQYQAQGSMVRPGYPAVARTPNAGAMPQNGNVPTPPQNEMLPTPADGSMSAESSAASYGQNYNGGYPDANGCGCGSYPNTGGYGDACGCQDYGLGGYMDDCCNDGPTCFGGIYGLYMTRENANYQRLAVRLDDNAVGSYPYYPQPQWTTLSTSGNDFDYQPGAEVRFGCTFDCASACDDSGDCGYGNGGYGGCGSGGCGSCAPTQTFAWEAAYWALEDDQQWAVSRDYLPNDNYRIYGMKNFAGLMYDRDGAGGTYAPDDVNAYYDYGLPIADPVAPTAGDYRVIAQRVRTNFSVQNLELNFLRLPLICGSTCSTGCDSCGYDACGGGCGGYASCGGCENCEPTCDSPFSLIGLCGVRYLRFDDDFQYANWYNQYDGANWSSIDSLYYDVNVDNNLVGIQLGANMNYCIGCKCNVFWDTNFGLYNNYMESQQRIYGSEGEVSNANGGSADWASHKDDVAFLGEMRLGGAYDLNCNWRGVLAYRAIGISGVALSADQIPNDFSDGNQIAWINSSGGLILHGVQAGVECCY